MHIEGHSTMLSSALNYVALRLLGECPNGGDGAMEKGRNWILDHGGAIFMAAWGKFWLSVRDNNPLFMELYAVSTLFQLVLLLQVSLPNNKISLFKICQVLGVYDWSGNNPVPPELWLLPHYLPFHPGSVLFLYILALYSCMHVCVWVLISLSLSPSLSLYIYIYIY